MALSSYAVLMVNGEQILAKLVQGNVDPVCMDTGDRIHENSYSDGVNLEELVRSYSDKSIAISRMLEDIKTLHSLARIKYSNLDEDIADLLDRIEEDIREEYRFSYGSDQSEKTNSPEIEELVDTAKQLFTDVVGKTEELKGIATTALGVARKIIKK